MGRFETFDHTADVGLRVEAESLADLLATAARGLVALVVANPDSVVEAAEHRLTLEAENPTDLLLAWLDEILFRIETRHELYGRFEVRIEEAPPKLGLEGCLWGEPISADRHILDHEVKAVTRHGAFVKCEGQRWRAEVVLDI